MASKRIEWIDLAKGFCIFLVVFHHTSRLTCVSYPFTQQIQMFRMPLYFILSGLFFKQYEGFVGFLKRKINKLLIPFLFFYIVTSSGPYWLLHHESEWPYFCEYGPIFNMAIWFLLCLFEVNVLFYLVQWVAGAVSGRLKTAIVLVLAIIGGLIGLTLSVCHLRIPCFVDTAFTALPFFAFGWWLRSHTQFLTYEVNLYRDVPLLVVCGVVVWLFASNVQYMTNTFAPEGIWSIHLTGIAGTIMVLTLARMIKHLPLFSFWGRYSIIILCTHLVIVTALTFKLKSYLVGGALFGAVLVITLTVCHFLILFMKRYMPHVTAQKDVLKIQD